MLELIYTLQQAENDPALKVLVFTEFVPTQAMLAGFLESRGVSDLPRWVPGQPLPCVQVSGLPGSVRGVWSLWVVSLCASASAVSANTPLENFNRKRFLPVFVAEDGRSFVPI